MERDLPHGTPIDRSRQFSLDDYPHQPEKYHMQPHFRQQMKDPERLLSGEVIARTITCGNLIDNEDGCAAFHWTRPGDGVQWWFIAGFHQDGYRIAVTAYPYLRDVRKAVESGRWTIEELTMLANFNSKTWSHKSLVQEYPQYVRWSVSNPHGGMTA